jgi:hypothetical protein
VPDKSETRAAMPGFWWGNGWFGLKNWTQMSTKIPLESSLQRLFIGFIKTWWFLCEIKQFVFEGTK